MGMGLKKVIRFVKNYNRYCCNGKSPFEKGESRFVDEANVKNPPFFQRGGDLKISYFISGAYMKTSISADSVVSQIEDIVASDIDDEKVMMSIERGSYYGLDPVGSRVWELIDGPVRVSELIDGLLLKYDVDRETCERDVLAFLEELRENGVVRVEDPPVFLECA